MSSSERLSHEPLAARLLCAVHRDRAGVRSGCVGVLVSVAEVLGVALLVTMAVMVVMVAELRPGREPPAPDIVAAPTCSCDHAKALAALDKRIDDVDVACLYRGHLLLTHEGRAARAVRDQPVPGAWTPMSPHIVPPVRADCAKRFR